MSEPFLTTTVDDMRVEVSVAWGADLTDLDGSSWTWTDITADVILGGKKGQEGAAGISIAIGRPDYSQETQTAILTCQLDNRDSAYSEGGMSANWPNIRRGTPVRVRVSDDNGATWSVRFQGAANGFTPQWDPDTGRWATVELSASGPLRRLNQGSGIGISAMREGTLSDSTVVAYWPMEDRQYSSFIAPARGGRNGQFRIYDPFDEQSIPGAPGDCASYSEIATSGPIVTLVNGGSISCDTPDGTTTTRSTTSVLFGNILDVGTWNDGNQTGYPDPELNWRGYLQTGCLFTVYTADGGAVQAWDVALIAPTKNSLGEPSSEPGRLKVYGYPNTNRNFNESTEFTSGSLVAGIMPGNAYEIALALSQSSSTTTWRLFVRRVGDTVTRFFPSSGNTVSSNANGAAVTSVDIGSYSDAGGLAAGHLVIRNTADMTLFKQDIEWLNGYPGEATLDRLERLCTTHGIAFDTIGSTVAQSSVSATETMGPQFYDTLTALLRECEFTGQGVLYDGLGPGLTYVTKQRRAANANGPASLVIDAAAAQMMEPFAPVDDDQLTINHVEVSRRGGTLRVHEDITGPVGMDAIGDYSTSYTVNCETDDDLSHYAQWTVGIGTQQGYRYPSVSFALESAPELIPGWLACLPQSRIDVENVTTIRRQHPEETIKLLVEGWQETIDAFTWRVTANTVSAAPWNVVRLAADTGSTGDGICHLDTAGSQLNANAAAGAASISVKTITGPIWVTTLVDSDSFPFDIDIGGIKATVTGVTGTTSPQTFTLAGPLPRAFTGSATTGAGTPVKVWRPPVFGL